MKLIANSSFGYQMMNRSRHTVTNYLNDKKTCAANYSKLFKKLNHVIIAFYEIERAGAEIEHKEPIIF